MVSIRLPRSIIERLERKAKELGLSLEEYILELVLRNLNSRERAQGYVEVAKHLLKQAREELGRGNVRQAAEKAWGAAALAVKAYAEWKEGRKLVSHGELWEYKREMEKEVGEWVYDTWAVAHSMHICFYEGWCNEEDVERAIKEVAKLVDEISRKVKAQDPPALQS